MNSSNETPNRLYQRLKICGKCSSCLYEDIKMKEGFLSLWYCDKAKDTGIFTTLIAGYIPKNGVIEGKMKCPESCPYRLEHILLEQ